MPVQLLVLFGVATVALLVEGCGGASAKSRKPQGGVGERPPPDHTYESVKPILQRSCVPCHQGPTPPGNCDLSTLSRKTPSGYVGVIACPPRLTILGQASHSSYLNGADRAAVECWWNNDNRARSSLFHLSPGWLNPRASDFHGEALAQNNWNMAKCQVCHGRDGEAGGAYGGGQVNTYFGKSVPSCTQCHGESPEGCTTCHGQGTVLSPQRSLRWRGSFGEAGAAAHRSHLNNNTLSNPVPCTTCHRVPARFDSEAHVDSTPPAKLIFGGLASYGGASPVWNRADASCSSVYCHGKDTRPTWTVVDGSQKTCASCHPQHSHGIVETGCSACHPREVDVDRKIINRSLHVDGLAQAGREGVAVSALTCRSCHDMEADTTVPLVWPGSLGPGAHWIHLKTTLTAPMTCADCHEVPAPPDSPATLFAAGHIDTPLPAEVAFPNNSRARLKRGQSITFGGVATWNRADATCAVYCHSPDPKSPTVSPAWNAPAAARCTACHGESPHPGLPPDQPCNLCHRGATDGDGNIIRPDLHMDGRVEF